MLKARLFFVVSGWLAVATLQAQSTNFITLNGQLVHPTRILAKYKDGVAAQPNSVLAANGLAVRKQFSQIRGLAVFDVASGPVLSAPMSPDAARQLLEERITALRDSGQFEYVEPDSVRRLNLTPTDAFFNGTGGGGNSLWGLYNFGQNGGLAGTDISAAAAWDLTTGSTNVIVAVIDTGIRYTHQDLATQMWRNPTEIAGNGIDDDNDGYVDNIFGINAINRGGDPNDDNGHGTHVSGTIGAAANNVGPHVGVNWNVRLMALKMFSATGAGTVGDEIECIDFAIMKRANIINMSLGGYSFSQAEFDAIARARTAGILVVAAAGNDGLDTDVFPNYPSSYQLDNILSVAAVDRFDRLAIFSNFGRNSVHVGAPGVEILSTINTSDNGYTTFDGTSMAAPHVAGVAALIRARSTNATYTEIRQRIIKGVVPTSALNTTTITGGRLNAYNSLVVGPDNILEVTVTPPNGSSVKAGSTIPVVVGVSDFVPLLNATVFGTVPLQFTNQLFFDNGTPPDALLNDGFYTKSINVPAASGTVSLLLNISAPGKTNNTTFVSYNILPPPSNDLFAAAAKFPTDGGTLTGINTFGGMEVGEPQHAGVATVDASVWWNWAPTLSGQVLVDTIGSDFDTVLAVYTGTSVSLLTQIASVNDSGANPQGHLFFNAVAGQTYRIAVAGATSNQFGNIRLRVAFNGQPDLTAPTVTVTDPPGSVIIVTNSQFTVVGTASDPQPNGSGVRDVLVKLNGGFPVSAIGTTNWSRTVILQESNNIVEVSAVDFANNVSAITTVTVILRVFDPPNDLFFQATPLTGVSGLVTNNTSKATDETGEPNHAGVAGDKSIWYSFVAPANGILFLSTSNSTFDTLLAVYTGNRVNQLSALASNDDLDALTGQIFSQLSQAVQAGETNYIAIDGVGGASGVTFLRYAFTPTTVYNVAVTTTGNGTVLPVGGQYQGGTVLNFTATPALNYDFVTWTGAQASLQNPLSITVNNSFSINALFLPHIFTDDFETQSLSRLPWVTGGAVPWTVQLTNAAQTHFVGGGRYFAQSGAIGNGTNSWLKLTAATIAGTGSFRYRVNSEPGGDFLQFYINGVNRLTNSNPAGVSGQVGWTNFQFSVSAGTNTFEWRYQKDNVFDVPPDAVYIDNVELPLVVPKDATSPANVVFAKVITGSGVEVRISGQTNQLYRIEASADLTNWQPISTNVAIHGWIQIIDPNGTLFPSRFYRAVVP